MKSSKRKLKRVREGSGFPDDPHAPEFFNSCKFYSWFEDIASGKIFPMACSVCDGCRQYKHESIVGRVMAESESAACVLSVCLTYDPKGDKPEGAVWLDYDDVRKFLMRIRKAGYKVRKFVAGEYGTQNGRAHWHLLLFFQWDEQHLVWWKDEQVYVNWKGQLEVPSHDAERRRDWRKYVPPLVLGLIPDKTEFRDVLADLDRLWVPTVGYKSAGEYPQQWRFWSHGHVQAAIVKAPGVGTDEELNRGVRYTAKYFSKDPWKDGKLRNIEFEKLPEWIKQATAYGPWDVQGTNERTKWVRGNKYGDAIDRRNLEQYASDDEVPISERRKQHKHFYKVVGGLGADHFRCLGGWYARQVSSDEKLIDRTFKLGPSYRTKHIQAVRKGVRNGSLPAVQKRNRFYMGDTAFRQFADGFNKYLVSLGKEETTGLNHIFDNLDTIAKDNADKASGPMGFHIWKDASKTKRLELERHWADVPDKKLRGIVPARLIRLLEDTSDCSGWQQKRRERLLHDKQGRPKTVTPFGRARIIETTQKRWFYEKDLDAHRVWWRREIITVENLEAAFAGTLVPENARGARFDTEGKGNQKPLAELDIRTVRKYIKNAWLLYVPF